MRFNNKLLSVMASVLIVSGINCVNATHIHHVVTPVLSLGTHNSNIHHHATEPIFTYNEMRNIASQNGYQVFQVPHIIPSNTKISKLLEYAQSAMYDLLLIDDAELEQDTKKRTMATVINMLETILYPINIVNGHIHNNNQNNNQINTELNRFADAINNNNSHAFDLAMSNLCSILKNFQQDNNYLTNTVAQITDNNFWYNSQNNNIIHKSNYGVLN